MSFADLRRRLFGPRPCGRHVQVTRMSIARLERDTGIDPQAVERLFAEAWARPDLMMLSDPDMIDCGSGRCRRWRHERDGG